MSESMPLHLQSLVETHESPFVLIDRDYKIVGANRAYGAAYGIEPGEIVGRCCYEVSHRRSSPCHLAGEDCPHRQVLASGKRHEVLHIHYDHHGHEDRVRIRGVPVLASDGQILLGECIQRLAPGATAGCEDMRLIARSPAMLEAIEKLRRAAVSNANVLLCGESGVGKELAAHYLHRQSRRNGERFLALNCATLGEHLFESEVFGHERGAFTGCIGRKQGLLEQADKGTLFLDEVGEMPLAAQAKLLRVLETGELRRLGGNQIICVDVRIVAATNRDLLQMVKAGAFREDLYYRLACITIKLPPLRERRSDIALLAEAILLEINRGTGSRCFLSGEALEQLMKYDFPGNVRELRNILQRGAALCSDGVISARDLALEAPRAAERPSSEPKPVLLKDLEADHIGQLLDRHLGNRREVATAMGISERTLYRKLKRYGLH